MLPVYCPKWHSWNAAVVRVALVFGLSPIVLSLDARAAVEGFEAESVPAEWTSEPADNLSIAGDVKHSGARSLRWKWVWHTDIPDTRKSPWDVPSHFTPGYKSDFKKNAVTFVMPAAFQKVSKRNSGLAVWIFTGRADSTHGMIRLELLGGDRVLACGYWYVSGGWMCLKIPYGAAGGARITGFRILAPMHSYPYWPNCDPTCAAIDDVDFDTRDTTYNGLYVENFERIAVPPTWRADARGSLEIAADRYYSGKTSLAWNWNTAGATLTCRWPEAFQRVGGQQCLAFWLYNEKPSKERITLEFLQKGRVLYSCWYLLNYRGWHVMAAPYAMLGWQPKTPPDAIRISAPHSMATGRLYFDFVNFNCVGEGALLSCAATPAADWQQPWLNDAELLKSPEKCVLSPSDPSRGRPWLPAPTPRDKITPEQLAFVARYRPQPLPPAPKSGGAKLPPAKMRELRERLARLEFSRDGDVVNGRPITTRLNNPPDAVSSPYDFSPLVGDLVATHYSARAIGDTEAAEKTKKALLTLLRYSVEHGHASISGNYRTMLLDDRLLAILKEWNETELHDALMASRLHDDSLGGQFYDFDPQGDSDLIGAYDKFIHDSCRLEPVRAVQNLQIAQRGINRLCVRANAQPLGPDGTFFHHGMHHWDYAGYEFPTFPHFIEMFAGTPFQLDKACYEVCKRYIFTMAWSADKYTMPANLPARVGNIRNVNVAGWASQLETLGKHYGYDPMDRELASLFLALDNQPDSPKAKQYRAAGVEPYKFAGHRVVNGAGTSIHRRDDWMFCVVGWPKYFFGYEIYGGATNSYSRHFRNGTHYLISSGNPPSCEASGWSFAGWDSFHFPGATDPLGSPQSLRGSLEGGSNQSAFIAGVDLDGDGVWGYEHRGREPHFNKSAFCFDRRITLLTSDIEKKNSKQGAATPLVTTLYQNAFAGDAAEPCFADGVEEKALPAERTLPPGSPHWLVDNKGTGYYVYAGQSPLKMLRRRQTWTYMWPDYLKDKNNDPLAKTGPTAKQYDLKTLESFEQYYKPTSNNFALAYFEHGVNPGAACGYTMLVRSNPKETAEFAEKMSRVDSAPCKILQQDATAHIVWDRETNTTGYALFAAGEVKATGPLLSASRPCVVMVRPGEGRVKLSFVPPDWKQTTPLVLTLRGRWRLESTDAAQGCKVEPHRDATDVTVSYDTEKPLTRYLPIHVVASKTE